MNLHQNIFKLLIKYLNLITNLKLNYYCQIKIELKINKQVDEHFIKYMQSKIVTF